MMFFYILGTIVASFRQDLFVSIGIVDFEVKSSMPKESRVVQGLMVIQQFNLKYHYYTFYERLLILSKYQCTNFLSLVPFNWCIDISNNSSFRQKHPGVADGSDGSDGTLFPLTENYTLPVAQATGRVA